MKALIETSSNLYHKRMAKEINAALEHGVYYHPDTATSIRVMSAKTKDGELHVKVWFALADAPIWLPVGQGVDKFSDGYGRDICASRC